MTDCVDFYFFFKSPFSYLGSTRLEKIARQNGLALNYIPIMPEVLWPAVGNEPQIRKCPPKFANAVDDIQRWATRYEVPFALNPAMDAIDGNRLAAGLFHANDKAAYVAAIFDAVWGHPIDLSSMDILRKCCEMSGQTPEAAVQIAGQSVDLMPLQETTRQAIEAGVFGAPSFVYDGKLFFGNDRLDFLAEAIHEKLAN